MYVFKDALSFKPTLT